MDEEPRHEAIGAYIAIFCVLIPGMMVSGFMPDWNVLEFSTWLLIATIGGGIGAAIATKRLLLGLLAGALAGGGALLGLYKCVDIRVALTGSTTFFSLELLIGGGIGAVPGLILYSFVAKPTESDETQ